MEKSQRSNKNTNTNVGFCLLPCELIQTILFHLCTPEIIRMKLLNKFVLTTISDQSFIRQLNDGSRRDTWIFVYTRRWRRDNGVLHGFSDRSVRWFKIPVAEIMIGEIFPGEDLYLLTASGNFLLFASNTHSGIIAVDLVGKSVRRIRSCPLGPRGTSSWRRSGLKLVPDQSDPDHFRFMFAEMVDNRPVLFTYHSNTATWLTKEAEDTINWSLKKKSSNVFLSLSNRPHESTVMCLEDGSMTNRFPAILRPKINQEAIRECPSSVGFSRKDLESQLLHIHGDEYKVIIKLDKTETNMKKMKSLSLWEISSDGEKWELVSRAPSEVISKNNKSCGVMMGCLERRLEVIRVALMTNNHEGLWNIIWLDYDKHKDKWEWVPLPDCRFLQGSNMAGISFSSGLNFSL